jgi:hypothetical protein
MPLRPFLLVLPLLFAGALIAACVTTEAGSAETGSHKWPDQARLKRQIDQCHLSKPPEGIPANEARVATLDYENQCYRQLTEIEHAKLNAMQDAISRNRAYKRSDQTLLKREPLPQCHLSKPPEGIPENEARVATLDYENQCYRQLAEIELGKLDALQEAAREMAGSPNVKHRIRHRWAARQQPFTTRFQATR